MQRRAVWRHWWTVAVILGLGLTTIAAKYTAPELGSWVLAPVGVSYLLLLISLVVNRPRPRLQDWGSITEDRDQRAAIKAVRRGTSIAPPARQHQAIDAVRREWFAYGLQFAIVSAVAANWTRRGDDSLRDLVVLGFELASYLVLLIAVAGTAYYALVLRRLDTLDDIPSATPTTDH